MNTLKRQKRLVKTITLHREYNTDDWGIEISGNGWQEGEWIGMKKLVSFMQIRFFALSKRFTLIDL